MTIKVRIILGLLLTIAIMAGIFAAALVLPRWLAAFLLMKNCCKRLPPRTAPCAWTAFYAFWALHAATEKSWKPRWKTLNSRAARYGCAGGCGHGPKA